MFGDYQPSLHDYLSILRRRALAMILVFGAVLTASVIVAFVLPRVYESTATILVEDPQVKVGADDGAPRSRPEERVRLIQQRLMTRENLIRIANDHQLFPRLPDASIAQAMRAGIRVDLMPGAGGDQRSALSFNLSFQHGDPAKALAVTQELANMFLTSNRQDRVDRASRTTEFLSGEAERVRKQLESLEAQIATFKSQGASPESAAAAEGGLLSMETDLRNVERDYRLAVNELRSLEVDLAAARRGVMAPGAVTAPMPNQAEQALEKARTDLAALRATYSENHPDVRALMRRIPSLEQAAANEARAQTPSRNEAREQAGLAVSRLEAQVQAARSRSELLASQQASLRASIARIRTQASQAPQREQELAGLQRDYDAAKAKYEQLRTQSLSAQVVENLEEGPQAERFTLLEPPTLPEYPIKPNRKSVVAAGIVGGIAAALGVALLLEMLLGRVWGVNALTAAVNQRPLAVIPYIAIGAEAGGSGDSGKRSFFSSLLAAFRPQAR
ncbi:MAG: Wzz/FepE/Etk N-terminal domain-containing protein [Acidovorax sp.]